MKLAVMNILVVAVAVSCLALAADKNVLKVTMVTAKGMYIEGEPIPATVVVTNHSPNALNIANAFVEESRLERKKNDGVWELCPGSGEQRLTHGIITPHEIKAEESFSYDVPLDEYCQVGTEVADYEVRFIYEMKPAAPDHPNRVLWTGSAQSNTQAIHVQTPTGTDAIVYEASSHCPFCHPVLPITGKRMNLDGCRSNLGSDF